MGTECCATKNKDDLLQEVRKDANISEYENKEGEFMLTSPFTKEKIIFEVQDNKGEGYSKEVSNIGNEMRVNPLSYINDSKQYKGEKLIKRAVNNINKPPKYSWSTKKSRIISDYFQNPKNAFKNLNDKIGEVQLKYKDDFDIDVYSSVGIPNKPSQVIWNGLSKSAQVDQEKILLERYDYNTIFSVPDYKSNISISMEMQSDVIISYFFFFKSVI